MQETSSIQIRAPRKQAPVQFKLQENMLQSNSSSKKESSSFIQNPGNNLQSKLSSKKTSSSLIQAPRKQAPV